MSGVGEEQVGGAGEAPGSPDRYRACASEELVEAYHQMLALSRVARAEASAMLVVLDEREVWQADGCAGMAAWVAASESIRLCNARSVLEVARGLARLPHCGAAAGRGELSGDQAVEVVRIADAQSDERWAQVAPGCTPSSLARFSRRHERATDAEAEADDACRRLRWRNDASHKMLLISARLPADQGEELTKVISAMAEDAERPADGVYEAFEARAADALVALASAKAHDYADSPRTLVVMHVGADALRTGGDGFAQSEGGTALAPEVARRIACDARLQVVIEDAHGVALGVGRASRVAPAWLARLVGERDSHACRFPGCGRRRGTQIHHITHWADMGPTDLVNLCTLCHRHHHLVHEKGWSLTGDPNQPGGCASPAPAGPPSSRGPRPCAPRCPRPSSAGPHRAGPPGRRAATPGRRPGWPGRSARGRGRSARGRGPVPSTAQTTRARPASGAADGRGANVARCCDWSCRRAPSSAPPSTSSPRLTWRSCAAPQWTTGPGWTIRASPTCGSCGPRRSQATSRTASSTWASPGGTG